MKKMKKKIGSQVDDLEEAHKKPKGVNMFCDIGPLQPAPKPLPAVGVTVYSAASATNTGPLTPELICQPVWRCRPKPSPQIITAFGSKSLPRKVGSRAPSDHYSLKENSFP